jgi:two-component system chemotaxis response regulator CheY
VDSPRKVLVLEDSALQAKMYRPVFARYPGCTLVYAGNGFEGLEKLALEPGIDLIILDINMPKMDGITFLGAMRQSGFGRIPVIVISTEGKERDIVTALKKGARAYLKKPWQERDMHQVIEKLTP